MSSKPNDLESLASKVEAEYDADALVYFGPINRPWDDWLIDYCKAREKKKNVLLLLASYGGDAHAAYRLARCLSQNYRKKDKISSASTGQIIIFVNSICASAGTLMTLAADRLILSDHAELGPLDVQLRKPDEVGERTSGLTPIEALNFLESETSKFFASQFEHLRFTRKLSFSTRMAADTATQLASGLLAKLYEQIDPLRVAEYDRMNRIASQYGNQIKTDNVKPNTIARLLEGYPSHEFCIDPVEAAELFNKIEQPSESLGQLAEWMKPYAKKMLDTDETGIFYLTEQTQPKPDQNENQKKDSHPNGGGEVAGERKTDGHTAPQISRDRSKN